MTNIVSNIADGENLKANKSRSFKFRIIANDETRGESQWWCFIYIPNKMSFVVFFKKVKTKKRMKVDERESPSSSKTRQIDNNF